MIFIIIFFDVVNLPSLQRKPLYNYRIELYNSHLQIEGNISHDEKEYLCVTMLPQCWQLYPLRRFIFS